MKKWIIRFVNVETQIIAQWPQQDIDIPYGWKKTFG
jgi:hypothetical protein